MFHATPQPPPPHRQRRLQILGCARRSKISDGCRAPSWSWKACARMCRIGQAVNSRIDAVTAVIAPATKASPPKAPRSASPMDSKDNSAISTTVAPAPIPIWRCSSSPNNMISHPAFQPRRPTANACRPNRTTPLALAIASQVPRRHDAIGIADTARQPTKAISAGASHHRPRTRTCATPPAWSSDDHKPDSQTPAPTPSSSPYQGRKRAASRPAIDQARAALLI